MGGVDTVEKKNEITHSTKKAIIKTNKIW